MSGRYKYLVNLTFEGIRHWWRGYGTVPHACAHHGDSLYVYTEYALDPPVRRILCQHEHCPCAWPATWMRASHPLANQL